MQGSTVFKVIAAVAALVFISALALMVYRTGTATLSWQMGEGDPILKFYPEGDGLYVISAANVSMVDAAGHVLWTRPLANTSYSAMDGDGRLYAYSYENGLNAIDPNGTVTLLTRQGMNHPPMVGADGTLFLRSWSVLSAIGPDGHEKWNMSSVVSDPVLDAQGNICFFMRPPDHVSDVYLYSMSPGGDVRWSDYFDAYSASTTLMPASVDGLFVYDEPDGVLYHVDGSGNTTWDHSMTYLGQYSLIEDEKDRLYLFYLWGTVHVINERGNLLSKFNPVITYNANLSYLPAAYNDTIYVVGDDKYAGSAALYALNLDGTLKWEQRFNSSVAPSIHPGGDIVCVDTEVREGGRLMPVMYVLDGAGRVKLTYKPPDGHPWEQVYVGANDTVFASTARGQLYALRG